MDEQMKVGQIKGVITLTDGSTSEFRITDGGWLQWNAEGWRDAKARLGETGRVLDVMALALNEENILVSDSDPDVDEVDE